MNLYYSDFHPDYNFRFSQNLEIIFRKIQEKIFSFVFGKFIELALIYKAHHKGMPNTHHSHF